jgi:hypothetical protein
MLIPFLEKGIVPPNYPNIEMPLERSRLENPTDRGGRVITLLAC